MYVEGAHEFNDGTNCSSANVVPLIWWYKKLAVPSSVVMLAILLNGKETLGAGAWFGEAVSISPKTTASAVSASPKTTASVPLTQIAKGPDPTIARSESSMPETLEVWSGMCVK